MRESLFLIESRFSQLVLVLSGIFLSITCLTLPFLYGALNRFQAIGILTGIYALGFLALVNSRASNRSFLKWDAPRTLLFAFSTYILFQYLGSYFGFPIKSIYPYATREEFVRLFSGLILIQFLASYASAYRRMIWLALLCALTAAYFVSLLSLYQLFRGGLPLELIRIHPNRNHVASFLELMAPIALGIAYYQFQHAKARSVNAPAFRLGMKLLTRDPWFLLALNANLVIVIGAIATLSKFSLLSLAVGYLAFFVLIGKKRKFSGASILLAVLTLIAFALAFYFVGHAFHARLVQAKVLDWQTLDMRVPFWERSLPLFGKFLWFGSGLGSFSATLVSFHRVTLNYFSDHLLNDYFELAIEVGIVGLAIYLAFWFTFLKATIKKAVNEKSYFRRTVTTGIVCGLFSVLARQTLVANFYDAVNSFYVFLSVGLVMAILNEDQSRDMVARQKKDARIIFKIQNWIFILMFVIGFISLTRRGLSTAFLGDHPIEMSYKRAFAVDPENANHPYALAAIYRNKSSKLNDRPRQLQKLREARARIMQAIHLNPLHLKYRIDFSEISLLLGNEDEGDRMLSELEADLPFDPELSISRGLYLAKTAESDSFDQRNQKLDQAASFFNRVQSTNQLQNRYLQSLKQKRIASLNSDIKIELMKRSSL